eukprot:12135-Heterococcus_DN1.PRE.4
MPIHEAAAIVVGTVFGRHVSPSKTAFSPLANWTHAAVEWVEGVKVSSIDVTGPEGRSKLDTLQATLLSSFLTQLLESGFLHADPQSGNFMLTLEGKLVILDYGLMTELPTKQSAPLQSCASHTDDQHEQRYALVEYVTHLVAKDYNATLGDLITLGFIDPRVGTDPEKAKLVVPLLAKLMEQLSEGGGAKTITVESVGKEVEV